MGFFMLRHKTFIICCRGQGLGGVHGYFAVLCYHGRLRYCGHCANVVLGIGKHKLSWKSFPPLSIAPAYWATDRWMMFRKEVVLKISVWVHAAHESGVKPGLWSKIVAWAHLGWAARAPSHQHRTIIQSYNHEHAPHYPQVAQRAARPYKCFNIFLFLSDLVPGL